MNIFLMCWIRLIICINIRIVSMQFIDKTIHLIRQLLANSNIPLQEIARQSGLELEHLQKVVTGEELPRFEDMEAVCEALGIDSEYIASIIKDE